MNHDLQPHFLQSSAWQSFQQKLGRTVLSDSGEGWSYLAIIEQSHGIRRLYCPYGPTARDEAALTEALAALKSVAITQRAIYLRIQPLGLQLTEPIVSRHRLYPVTYSQPSQTWVIDLSKPTDQLLADMKQNTRNIVRNYHKKGLSYRASQDPSEVTHLLRLLHQVAAHNQISLHSDNYLTTQATTLLESGSGQLHFIEYQSTIIAAVLTYQDDTTVYYAHAAADHQHRKLGASTALVGEILLRARAAGKTHFDLYGIAPTDDPSHRWAGFTKFKQSFGGQQLALSQTYEVPIRRLPYRLYRFARSIFKTG